MASSNSDRDDMITGINVTPLVDVALVLLIILMVTASYVADRGIPLELPRATTGESAARALTISIDRSGAFYLDGAPVTLSELRERARARAREPDPRAVVAADGNAAHRSVVRALDTLREVGISRFAFTVNPDDLATRNDR